MSLLKRSSMAIAVCLGAACGVDGQGLLIVEDGGVHASDARATGDDAGSTGNVDGGAEASSSGGGSGSGSGVANVDSGGAGIVGTDSGGVLVADSGGAAIGDSGVALGDASAQCGLCPHDQHCDLILGCVTCTMDSHCPASARYCVLGSCVQCKTNTDCGGTTPSCWPGIQMCHAACTSNQQCAQDGNARICNTSTGACVGCNSTADCPTSQSICDPTTQQCVQCSSSADCAGTSTPACLRNRCVECATSADCPNGMPYCATGDPPRCVQCLQNAQCPPNAPSCNGGTCGKSGG
jgi:Cys-rich repeat protein